MGTKSLLIHNGGCFLWQVSAKDSGGADWGPLGWNVRLLMSQSGPNTLPNPSWDGRRFGGLGVAVGLLGCGWQCPGLEVLASSHSGAIDGSETWWDEGHTLRAVQNDQQDRTPLRND